MLVKLKKIILDSSRTRNISEAILTNNQNICSMKK